MRKVFLDTFRLTFYGFGLGIGMSGSFYLFGFNNNKEKVNIDSPNNKLQKIENNRKNSIEITSDIYN